MHRNSFNFLGRIGELESEKKHLMAELSAFKARTMLGFGEGEISIDNLGKNVICFKKLTD